MKIDTQDLEFILENVKISYSIESFLRIEIEKAIHTKSKRVTIDDELADELRDRCSDQLSYNGFDHKYNVNKLGQKLEELIDTLFTG